MGHSAQLEIQSLESYCSRFAVFEPQRRELSEWCRIGDGTGLPNSHRARDTSGCDNCFSKYFIRGRPAMTLHINSVKGWGGGLLQKCNTK